MARTYHIATHKLHQPAKVAFVYRFLPNKRLYESTTDLVLYKHISDTKRKRRRRFELVFLPVTHARDTDFAVASAITTRQRNSVRALVAFIAVPYPPGAACFADFAMVPTKKI